MNRSTGGEGGRAAPRPDLDPEVLEVLQEEPELLAIADALRATRTHERVSRGAHRALLVSAPRARILLATAVIAVAAGTIVAVTRIGVGGELRLIDDAQAALRGKPVVHAVVVYPLVSDTVVTLSTGRASASVVRVDVWVDAASAHVHVVSRKSQNGRTVAVNQRAAKAAAVAARGSLDARASAYIGAYRTALEQRRLVVISAKRRVLGIRGPHGLLAYVALGENYLPRRITPRRGSAIELAVVQLQDRVPRLPTLPASTARGSVVGERPATRATALRTVPGSRDLGASMAGLPLNATLVQRLVRIRGGRSLFSYGVAFQYGSLSGRFVELREARAPEPAYMYQDGRTVAGNPIPAHGAVDIHRFSNLGAGSLWLGQMTVGGVYATLRASSRPLLIDAARALIAESR